MKLLKIKTDKSDFKLIYENTRTGWNKAIEGGLQVWDGIPSNCQSVFCMRKIEHGAKLRSETRYTMANAKPSNDAEIKAFSPALMFFIPHIRWIMPKAKPDNMTCNITEKSCELR